MRKTLTLAFALFAATLTAQNFHFQIPDKSFHAGDTVFAEYRCYSFADIVCFQFAFKADTAKADFLIVNGSPLEFAGNFPGLDNNDFSWHGKPGYNLTPGELRCVWTNPYGSTVADGLVVFKVRLKAKQAGSLASAFQLWGNHPVLKIRAYKNPLTVTPFDIVYVAEEVTATETPEPEPLRVWPNPFADTFFVTIPEGITAIRLYDANSVLLGELNTSQCAGKEVVFKTSAPDGLYFIEARDGERVQYVRQLIKQ